PRALAQAPIQVLPNQARAQPYQRAGAPGRFVAIHALEDQLPAPIQGGGLNHLVSADPRRGVPQERQPQVRAGNRWLPKSTFGTEGRPFPWERLTDQFMPTPA